jgi:hypothetical protein
MSLTQGSPLPNITTTQSQTTTAPTWYTDYLSNLATGATTAAGAAKYQGAQPLQTLAFNAAERLPGTFQSGITDAAALAKSVGDTNVAERAGQFMQPYTSQVVDALGILGKRNINEFLAPQAVAGAVGSGQFGSKRGAAALGQAVNTGLQNVNAAQAQALQTGYTQALQAAQADQANKLNASQQMGALATAGQNMSLADINALATMGGQQQTIEQNEEMFPLQALNAASQTVRGFTVPTNVAQTYTGPIPGAYASSPLSQIAGLGAIIAGGSSTPFGQAIGSGLSNWWNSLGSNPFAASSGNLAGSSMVSDGQGGFVPVI